MKRAAVLLYVATIAVTAPALAKRKPEAPLDAGAPPASLDEFTKLATPSLLAGLTDPESARITWDRGLTAGTWKQRLSKPVVGWLTCGLINSKNQYGGYAGARRFVAVYFAGKIIFTQIGDGTDFDLVTAGCNDAIAKGVIPPGPGK